jgi:hypothetical protein
MLEIDSPDVPIAKSKLCSLRENFRILTGAASSAPTKNGAL